MKAGPTLGESSPASLPGATVRRVPSIPSTSRTRRTHGACNLGGGLATVTSSRREGEARAVELTLEGQAMTLSSRMTPTQARSMARALLAAAVAAEGVQRRGGAATVEGFAS